MDQDPLISSEEATEFLERALGYAVAHPTRIPVGSTNILFAADTQRGGIILKIAYRTDRINQHVLEKEGHMLEKFADAELGIAIPRVLAKGSLRGFPALVETALGGEHTQHVLELHPEVDVDEAASTLGQFVARLHRFSEGEITEFEMGKPIFPDFPSFVLYYLEQWRELCFAAPHISRAHIERAYARVEDGMRLFTESRWQYQHADISKENLLGTITHGRFVFTGLCDFENMQTGPIEYDIATLEDALFLFYPQFRQLFLDGYVHAGTLPQLFEERLVAVCLFRALRYIKRSVKYRETHYYEHDRAYLGRWLEAGR